MGISIAMFDYRRVPPKASCVFRKPDCCIWGIHFANQTQVKCVLGLVNCDGKTWNGDYTILYLHLANNTIFPAIISPMKTVVFLCTVCWWYFPLYSQQRPQKSFKNHHLSVAGCCWWSKFADCHSVGWVTQSSSKWKRASLLAVWLWSHLRQ